MSRPLQRTSVPGVYRRGHTYVLVLRDRSGRQFKRFADTLNEARALRAQLVADIDRGELGETRRTTLNEYFAEWRHTYGGRSSRGLRQNTMDDYIRVLQRDALPMLGELQLADIRMAHIKRYAATLAARGLANNTIRRNLAPLRALLATAVEDGLIRSNPAAGFRNVYGVRRQDTFVHKALSDDELVRLLDAVPESYRELLEFLAETGLRIGEAIELRWKDVDFAAGRVHVQRRWYKDGVDAPKSRFGIRAVPLTPERAQALADRAGRAEQLLFTNSAGQRHDSCNLMKRIVRPASIVAGIPWATVHCLRHTCASRLFRAGWNAKQVQMMLGHHSPAFTLATYVHLMPDDLPMPLSAPSGPALRQPA
ncbi:MAG: hypothetical protein JWM90_513 [Thermoleophilia bacterium]|nr:hypothetical protein [Thermoleophilia bacterium]